MDIITNLIYTMFNQIYLLFTLNYQSLYYKYEERRAKELKNLISKMNSIINDDNSYNTTEDDDDNTVFICFII